ncbi:hypothetical protein V1283_008378 [Bradyrhizobium sp. AZCC 2262]
MPGQKREARLRARCPGHSRFRDREDALRFDPRSASPHLRRRGAEPPAEAAVEIGHLVEAAGVGDVAHPYCSVRRRWTVGGAEWAFAANWSAKAEYLYYDLGSLSHLMTDPNFPSIFNAKADFTGHIARLGVNYRF